MKNIFTIMLSMAITVLNAQVIIGDAVGTATTKTSVLLEFAAGQNKGIIVPYVRTLPSSAALVGGTIVLDATAAGAARMKFYDGTDWIDLSGQDGNLTGALTIQPPITVVETGSKSIIGASTSSADGVLVLESSTKAMVLPTIADVNDIPAPSPGMMVYINKSGAKRLAVYNGSKWSFWRGSVNNVPTVTSPTGRVWMDRNLGATQVATSATDAASFGDLYQWGRLKDGHEIINSPNTSTLSTGDVPGNNNFITTNSAPYNWRATPNVNLWQGVNGINNPCPEGFRIPTSAEFVAETALFTSQNTAGAFASILKLPLTSYRSRDGSYVPNRAYYWASDITINQASELLISDQYVTIESDSPGYGQSVRCTRD